MRIEPFSLFSFWLVAFSLVASSSEGQYASKYNYESPRLHRNLDSPGMRRTTYRLESTPFGIDVRLFLNNSNVVMGELLFVDEESITILTPHNDTETFQLKELNMINGRFGRIAHGTRGLQFVGVLSALTTGWLTLGVAPVNLIIAAAVNSSLKKSLRLQSRYPQIDWRFLKTYSRYPARWPNSELMP
tara:strand:+ start:2174 stop:2737 length:564 start_codon:yes stop_codon:yes gene_type:complete